MTRFVVQDRRQEVGALLRAARKEGALVETGGRATFALLPLTDEVLDFLLETSPRLIAECDRIRQDMRAGKYYTHEEVKRILGLGRACRGRARSGVRQSRRTKAARR